mgnify:CR=1 FL=1
MSINQFAVADRVSDCVVAAINAELSAMRSSGKMDALQLLMGVCLGLFALERTMAREGRPKSLVQMLRGAENVARECRDTITKS